MTDATTIHVSNIGHSTAKESIHDFFTFCGKIESISITPASSAPDALQSATVVFEKGTAANTALLLDHTVLDGQEIHVEKAASLDNLASKAEEDAHHADELRQEDKPKTAILAEYLAHGYFIGDQALKRGIELDQKHGITSRFSSYLNNFDNRVKATDKARAMDNTYGVTNKANQGLNTVSRYFESALNTPTGQKVRDFYTMGSKQVLDIHNEAKRLKDLKVKDANCVCGGEGGTCNCPGGNCTCAGCSQASSSGSGIQQPVSVGDHKTACTCAGQDGVCGCKPGECTCEGCTKARQTPAEGTSASTNPYAPPPTEKYA